MAETIESFVKKLQTEGVEAGQAEAEKLKNDAQAQADAILKDAREAAEKIKKDAEGEAAETLKRAQTELELAARDAALKLQDTLSQALQQILTGPVEAQLNDVEFLKTLMTEAVTQYAKSDAKGEQSLTIAVADAQQKELDAWVRKELAKAAEGAGGVDLQGTLKQAGFEYSLSGGTVEVTRDSIVATLGDMLSQALRKTLTAALTKGNG